MERFTIYARESEYQLPMQYYAGNLLDNEEALNHRFCLVLLEKGSGILTIGKNQYFYMSPCLFCINEQEHIVIPETEGTKLQAVFFHPRIINCGLDFLTTRDLPENCSDTLEQDRYSNRFFVERSENYYGRLPIGPMTSKRIAMLMSRIDTETREQSGANWPCRSRSFLMELLFLMDNAVIEEHPFHEPSFHDVGEQLRPVLIYLFNHYEQKITIDQLTSTFHMNRTTLSKLFQDQLGESFVTYLNKLRITIASQLLRDTMLPVAEIMEKAGFHDPAHFLRVFKKETSYSPSDYRKKFNWM